MTGDFYEAAGTGDSIANHTTNQTGISLSCNAVISADNNANAFLNMLQFSK
jgi:hypothetical protein